VSAYRRWLEDDAEVSAVLTDPARSVLSRVSDAAMGKLFDETWVTKADLAVDRRAALSEMMHNWVFCKEIARKPDHMGDFREVLFRKEINATHLERARPPRWGD
jgi:hypothetical protein